MASTQTPPRMPSLMDAERHAPTSPLSTPSDPSKAWANNLKVGGSILAILIAIVILWLQIFGGGRDAEVSSKRRDCIDAESGEVFLEYGITTGSNAPWKNPKTGKMTLFPAEKCFWTKDGQAKLEPTLVLLNRYVGKDAVTICPDCGRKVVLHNPMPPGDLIEKAAAKASGGK